MAEVFYRKVADGNFEPVTAGATGLRLRGVLAAVGRAVQQNGQTVPRPVAAVAATALGPTVADNLGRALACWAAGDYAGAAGYGLPVVVAVAGALVALVTPGPAAALPPPAAVGNGPVPTLKAGSAGLAGVDEQGADGR